MGWKGTTRSAFAMMRKIERENERIRKYEAKIDNLEYASDAVDTYEEYLESLISTHKYQSCDEIDWHSIAGNGLPAEPNLLDSHEKKARFEYENFEPNMFHKLLKQDTKQREALASAIQKAKDKDKEVYQDSLCKHREKCEQLKNEIALAQRLISMEGKAFAEVIKTRGKFDTIKGLGANYQFSFQKDGDVIAAVKVMTAEDVIPKEKLTLRQSGSLSSKAMPKGEHHELYQDYVCSSMLRMAIETFALLPIDQIIINASTDILNTQTGHIEEQVIASVFIPRSTINHINLRRIDPSDSMQNFVHNMTSFEEL